MKKALLAVLATAAIFAATASAATAGTLTGSANFGPVAITSTPATPVHDGGISYVGAGNDLSGNCNGDTGTLTASAFGFGPVVVAVSCAHFVASSGASNLGSPKMRFAFQVPIVLEYIVVRITDNGVGTDTLFGGLAGVGPTGLANAIKWVNTGVVGSGQLTNTWTQFTYTSGDFSVVPG